MKKFIALALCGVLMLSVLAGCTSSGNSNPSESVVQPSEEITSMKADAPAFQVGEKVIKIGDSTVNDLINAGAVLSTDSLVGSIDFSEDPLFQRELIFTAGATELHCQVKNMTESIAPIGESIIRSVYFEGQNACGVGGVMVGDTLDDLTKKLGEPYLIINSEDFMNTNGQASMTQNARVYAYTSQYDDITVRVCVDRNTSKVTLIEEIEPVNLITEPKMVDNDQIKALIERHDKNNTGTPSATLMDTGEENMVSGPLSNITYNKIKVMTINDIRDSKVFYQNQTSYSDSAVKSTYLVVEYTATLTLNQGTDSEATHNVFGCFYMPNAYITDEGEIACGGNNVYDVLNTFMNADGVYKSEETMLKTILPDATQGYTLSDFTVMEQAVK